MCGAAWAPSQTITAPRSCAHAESAGMSFTAASELETWVAASSFTFSTEASSSSDSVSSRPSLAGALVAFGGRLAQGVHRPVHGRIGVLVDVGDRVDHRARLLGRGRRVEID